MNSIKIRNWIYFLSFLYILIDSFLTFYTIRDSKMDGDIVNIVTPCVTYSHVLKDPFGIQMILKGDKYPSSNRFFSNISLITFFDFISKTPRDTRLDVVENIYNSIALFKVLIQLVLSFLIASFLFPKCTIKILPYWAFIVSFFQFGTYYNSFGIVDHSFTYVFFYAFPFCFITYFYLILFRKWYFEKPNNTLNSIILALLFIITPFFGALSAVVHIFVIGSIFSYKLFIDKNRNFNSNLSVFLILFLIYNLYSMYIGSLNSENLSDPNTFLLKITSYLEGVRIQFFTKIGSSILILFLIYTYFILKKGFEGNFNHKLLKMIPLSFIFAILYLSLLPFGGYRTYREHYIRYDTFMPVTIMILILMALSMKYIFEKTTVNKKIYVVSCLFIMSFFTISDIIPKIQSNRDEKRELTMIALSENSEIILPKNTQLMNWGWSDQWHVNNIAIILKRIGILKEHQILKLHQ